MPKSYIRDGLRPVGGEQAVEEVHRLDQRGRGPLLHGMAGCAKLLHALVDSANVPCEEPINMRTKAKSRKREPGKEVDG